MKTIIRLWTVCCLSTLCCFPLACSTDSLPEATDEDTVSPTESPDAYHDKTREKPYPKADNEIYLNPTPLIVPQAMKNGDKLQFALSRQEDFTGTETFLSTPKAWCMFNPHQSLQKGTWYWRFRSIDTNGTEQSWSETYSFEVKAETPQFVTPAFDVFLNNAPRTHPRLHCFLDDGIEQARRTITSHPEYKELLSRAKTALNTDYSVYPNPYDKAADIKVSIQHLYQAYHLTQQKTYADKLHEILTLLFTHPVSDAQLFASNFGSTDIAICFIEPYDLLYATLTPDERQQTEELLLRVARYYFKMYCGMQENHIFDNHFWQHNMRVLFQAAFVLYDKGNYAVEILPMLEYYYELWTARAPASGFNRDGIWLNGSGYFTANTKTLYYMPSLFSYITNKDFLQHPWYQNAGKAMVYTWPPESKSAGFGDGSEKGDEPDRQRVAFADFIARETGDSYAGWYAGECQSTLRKDYDLRLYRMVRNRSYTTDLPPNSPKLVWYKDAGEVAIHSDLRHTDRNLSLNFRSSTFGSGSHTLSNQNSFNLLYQGSDIYRSSGYYLNFSDAHNLMSYRHTRAHNTILVNGIGQPYSLKGYGYMARAMGGDHISYCLGDASHAYSGISDDPMWVEAFQKAGITQTPENGFGTTPLTLYRRHLLVLHPNTVVIYDELEAAEPVRWEWLLHSPTQFTIDNSSHRVSTTNTAKGFTTTTQLFSDQLKEIAQTDEFVVPPLAAASPLYPNQWHLTASFTLCAKNRILTIIQVNPSNGQRTEITRQGDTFQCGDYLIHAVLDHARAAKLTVTHQTSNAVFSYSEENPVIDGGTYLRKYPHSSLLYDISDGNYRVTEQTDYQPISTRMAP